MKSRFLPVIVLVAVAAFGIGRYAKLNAATETLDVVDYRTALDQMSAGRSRNAQALLETAQSRGDIAPENALLLAYLQERAGQAERARATLGTLNSPSPLVESYLDRLGGPQIIETAAGKAKPSGTNPARLAVSDARIVKLEKMMLGMVNAARQKEGLRALTWNDDIAEVARAHSAEMRDKKYFAHESPTPKLRNPLDRYVLGIGDTPRLVGENVYRAWGSESSLNASGVTTAHESLMKSPGHRANILLDGATHIGIGIVSNSTGDIWVTQVFAKP